MKKTSIVFALAAVLLLSSFLSDGYAQWHIGGSVGASTASREYVSESFGSKFQMKDPSTVSFGVSPRLGYFLGERTTLGAAFEYTFSRTTYKDNDNYVEGYQNMHTYGVMPYFRYDAVRAGRFTVALELGVGVYGRTGEANLKPEDEADIEYSGLVINAGLTPVLQFDISRRIMLESRLNFLGINYFRDYIKAESVKGGEVTQIQKETTEQFGMGFDTDNLLNVGSFTIGFVYKF